MKRRAILAAALLPALAHAARPLRIYAITYRGKTEVERGFADYFSTRGIAVDIIWRDIALDPSKLPALVDEIRRERPDLVYTWGTGVTLGIAGRWNDANPERHITDIPLVFSLVAAPVDTGIVAQLHAPGRNVTGVSHMAGLGAQVQAMSTYQAFRKIGVLYSPNEPNSLAMLTELNALGAKQGFSVLAQPFKLGADGRHSGEGAADIVRGFKADGAGWLYMPPDSFLNTQARDVVVPAALEAQLPVFASTEQLMAAGALLGLVSRYYNIGQFAAYKAEQILINRTAPGRIPVETLTRFSLQINLPVARRLNVLPPLEMFNYAELIGDASKQKVNPS